MPKKRLKSEFRSARNGYRLRLEPLEARRLLAGLQVSVFVDQDGSRSFDAAQDLAAPNRLVYVDLNQDGDHNFGEPIQVTSEDGTAFFDGLEIGDYTLGLLSNPEVQKQVTSVTVSGTAEQISDSESQLLLSTPFQSELWSVNAEGVAQNLNDLAQSVDFGGPVVSSSGSASTQYLVVDRRDNQETLVEFDLLTGSFADAAVDGLQPGDRLTQVFENSDGTWAIVESPSGSSAVQLEFGDGSVDALERIPLGGQQISVAKDSPLFGELAFFDGEMSSFSVRDLSQGGDEIAAAQIDGEIQDLHFAADGSRIYALMAGGGINVFAVVHQELSLEAILADASGPLSVDSLDGRIVTGSSSNSGEIIVWDSANWTIQGRSDTGSTGAHLTQLLTDRFGDRVLAITGDGVFAVDLNVEVTPNIQLTSQQSIAHQEIGVRLVKENQQPVVNAGDPRVTTEDQADLLTSSELGVEDPDGDDLWFSVQTPPSNGELQIDDTGWTYLPAANFNGRDQAVLRVHDGVSFSELQLEWEVLAVNDPPEDVLLQVPQLAENAAAGQTVGFLSIVDPDSDANYRITTSDSRFEVQDGQIVFTGGQLDFESESEIAFQVRAVDLENSAHQIESSVSISLQDINEPPTSLDIQAQPILENEAGAVVGSFEVEDPDADSEYEFLLDDGRFEVRDGILKLIAGAVVDYEAEQQVRLTITAKDVNKPENAITEEVTVEISNSNEPPTELLLDRMAVASETPGAVVGSLAVTDEDRDVYEFSVADERFEVAGNVLKLKAGQSLESTGTISLNVSALALSGDTISRVFPIVVDIPMSSHQNQDNPSDVNNDGMVTPVDALILVNELNSGGGGPLPTEDDGEGPGHLMDVNGDGVLSPMDVLIIINELNNAGMSGEGEEQFVDTEPEDVIYGPILESHSFDPLREKSAIDSELELLLSELSEFRNQHKRTS